MNTPFFFYKYCLVLPESEILCSLWPFISPPPPLEQKSPETNLVVDQISQDL